MKHPIQRAVAFLFYLFLLTPAARGASLTLEGAPLDAGPVSVYEDTTFVSLRAVAEALIPDAAVSWQRDRAVVQSSQLTLTASPGENALICNGGRVELAQPVLLEEGCTLVPVRPLAALLGAQVSWDPATGTVDLSPATRYAQDDLYWLSRIISAESRGECWEGKIAVGNVVLNRVRSNEFPDTIYGVIFDERWGGQFEPVRNGTVYLDPTPESIEAARACLEGANTVGESLYFLAPHLTDNHWTMENRTYITTIGAHWFYE